MIIVLAFSIYEEYYKGEIKDGWKVDDKNKVDFYHFREILSIQLLIYSLQKQNYLEDARMRAVTLVARVNRNKRRVAVDSLGQFKKAKRYSTLRLCSNLDKLCTHVKGIMKLKKLLICAWCSKPAYTVCGKCKDNKGKRIVLYYNTKAGDAKGHHYFYYYHNDTCFRLGKNDANSILNGKKGD